MSRKENLLHFSIDLQLRIQRSPSSICASFPELPLCDGAAVDAPLHLLPRLEQPLRPAALHEVQDVGVVVDVVEEHLLQPGRNGRTDGRGYKNSRYGCANSSGL